MVELDPEFWVIIMNWISLPVVTGGNGDQGNLQCFDVAFFCYYIRIQNGVSL